LWESGAGGEVVLDTGGQIITRNGDSGVKEGKRSFRDGPFEGDRGVKIGSEIDIFFQVKTKS